MGVAARMRRAGTIALTVGALAAGALTACSVSVAGSAARVSMPSTTAHGSATSSSVSGSAVAPDSAASPSSPRPTPSTGTKSAGSKPAPPATRSTTPVPTSLSLAELRDQHDVVIDGVLTNLTLELLRDHQDGFLKYFDAALAHRVGAWFSNTRELGVTQARLVRMPGYYSQRDDRPTAFSRSVVLGVRTPYDDDDSLPGVTYSLTMSKTSSGWRIASWKPSYVDDPMNCDCTLSIAHTDTMAVVSSGHEDLRGWPQIALDGGGEGVRWARAKLQGSGLLVPKGQVIFLADAPYRWFLDAGRPPARSNATISLVDAAGKYPGQDYSAESRIVVTVADSEGGITPQNARGALYVADVITHESTHQLMSRNSRLYYGDSSPIDTWIVEGIAVAVEVLHRHDHPETEQVDYPQPDDPRNADSGWLAEHVNGTMPTTAQLYSSELTEQNYWYGVAGSVFLYLEREYGYPEMMKVAGQLYAKNNQSPFQYFPDQDHPGSYLTATTAKAQWLQWFKDRYES